MRGFVVAHQEEWLVLGAASENPSQVSDDVRGVAGMLVRTPIWIKSGS